MFPTEIACCARATEHPRASDPQRRVLLIRRHDQRVEGRILENRPPILQVAVMDFRVVCGNPFVGDGCRRGAIIRPDLEAVANPLPRTGGDATAVQCQRNGNRAHRDPPPRKAREDWVVSLPGVHLPAHKSVRRLQVFGTQCVRTATANLRTIPTFRNIGMTGARDREKPDQQRPGRPNDPPDAAGDNAEYVRGVRLVASLRATRPSWRSGRTRSLKTPQTRYLQARCRVETS